ncbi:MULTISPECIES: hypothetical protein [Campylobacter]|nr:hypothetical protein [Campylobacter sp. RM8835]MCR8701874.1 hypothetical protein [Campylobacter sp. RM12176]
MNGQTLILTITLILGAFVAYKLLTTKDKSEDINNHKLHHS